MLHSSPGPGPPVVVVDEVASVRAWVVVGSEADVDVDVDAEAVVLTESLATVAEAVVVAESTAGSLAWQAEAAARARRGSHEGGCEARGCAGGVVWVVMVRRRRLGSVRWRWLGQAAEADVLHSWRECVSRLDERDTLGPLSRQGAGVRRVHVAV